MTKLCTCKCNNKQQFRNSLSVYRNIGVAFANSLELSVGRRQFVALMSPVQGHVACRNLTLTGPQICGLRENVNYHHFLLRLSENLHLYNLGSILSHDTTCE